MALQALRNPLGKVYFTTSALLESRTAKRVGADSLVLRPTVGVGCAASTASPTEVVISRHIRLLRHLRLYRFPHPHYAIFVNNHWQQQYCSTSDILPPSTTLSPPSLIPSPLMLCQEESYRHCVRVVRGVRAPCHPGFPRKPILSGHISWSVLSGLSPAGAKTRIQLYRK